MICLYTDFGGTDLYVGQVKARLLAAVPGLPLIDLLHDAPAFDVEASAHLLEAMTRQLPAGAVTMAVVDPGVGTARRPVVLRAGSAWFVGPDNGLLSVVAQRAGGDVQVWEIAWRPQRLSYSFHGRDLFAPMAARLALEGAGAAGLVPRPGLDVLLPAADLARVIYVDHYGNCMTGIRAHAVDGRTLACAGTTIRQARVFGAVSPGEVFWYANSLGLVEVAVNRGSAAAVLGLTAGAPVRWAEPARRGADG
jgi:S-adenosylmethionine hydrolase